MDKIEEDKSGMWIRMLRGMGWSHSKLYHLCDNEEKQSNCLIYRFNTVKSLQKTIIIAQNQSPIHKHHNVKTYLILYNPNSLTKINLKNIHIIPSSQPLIII